MRTYLKITNPKKGWKSGSSRRVPAEQAEALSSNPIKAKKKKKNADILKILDKIK
jgi:hypothetical protein